MSGTEPFPHTQWAEALRWFAKALEDRNAAERLLTAEPPLLDPAAYHCQQAAEKILKGLLAAIGVTIPKSHDLQHLASLVGSRFQSLTLQIEPVSLLTTWGTETRYPRLDEGLGLSLEDIRKALSDLDVLHASAMCLGPAQAY